MGGLTSNHPFYPTLQICKYPKLIPHSEIIEWGNFLGILGIFGNFFIFDSHKLSQFGVW
jgi:hypothetical protein